MEASTEVILKIVEYIERHLEEGLDLDKIAEISGYSKYHISRVFNDRVGETIHQYIKKRRITEAARNLVFTNKPIVDIAFSTGYESQQAFSLAFKKLYMESPQTYRKNKVFWPIQLKVVMNSKVFKQRRENVSYNNFNIKCEVKAA
ncbi:MAG: helix-turn-helix domain-containing protein [Clostridium sp.]